jgi:hypothetical protein
MENQLLSRWMGNSPQSRRGAEANLFHHAIRLIDRSFKQKMQVKFAELRCARARLCGSASLRLILIRTGLNHSSRRGPTKNIWRGTINSFQKICRGSFLNYIAIVEVGLNGSTTSRGCRCARRECTSGFCRREFRNSAVVVCCQCEVALAGFFFCPNAACAGRSVRAGEAVSRIYVRRPAIHFK